MFPERKIRNEGDRQELMAEELAGGDLEGEELELGAERTRRARPRPREETPEIAAPAIETSEGTSVGMDVPEARGERRTSEGGGRGRGKTRRSRALTGTASNRGRTSNRGRNRRVKTSAEKRSSRRTKQAVAARKPSR